MHILITHAIPQEKIYIQIPESRINQIITGIGKVNSAISLYSSINQNRPDLVLNIGTAGSIVHPVGSIIICSAFRDRDMEPCMDFGVAYYHSFSQELSECYLNPELNISHTCNTGDSFVTSEIITKDDVFDMEVFAQAALCKKLKIPLISIKYVTDIIGKNSIKHWEDKLESANKDLHRFFQNNLLFNH